MLVAAFAFNSWVLDPRHFFYADDWDWLGRSQFRGWSPLLQILPQKLYNDRPGGAIIIKLMYDTFGLSPEPYNLLWLLIHVANCGIFFLIARSVLPPGRALLAALLSACWFATLGAVNWIGGVFDLVGASWCMLALLFHILAARQQRGSAMLVFAAVLFHVLAIRTKEFSLVLVMVLAAWDWLLLEAPSWRARARRLLPHALVALVYLTTYVHLYLMRPTFVAAGAYRMSLSASSLAENIAYYFAHAFYLDAVRGVPLPGLAMAVVFVLATAWSNVGRASIIAAGLLSAAVLVLASQRSGLYLYVPHFFIALALCSIRVRSRTALAITAILVSLLVLRPSQDGSLRNVRNFVLSKGAYSRGLFEDYARVMQGQPRPALVTIGVSQPYFDPFTYGSGEAVRLFYKDAAIKVDVVAQTTAAPDACADVAGTCLQEEHGHLVRKR